MDNKGKDLKQVKSTQKKKDAVVDNDFEEEKESEPPRKKMRAQKAQFQPQMIKGLGGKPRLYVKGEKITIPQM